MASRGLSRTGVAVAIDSGLAQRIRDALAPHGDASERRMFGGIAFMLDGHMVVGVIGGTLMARVGAAGHRDALAMPHVREMDFTGRPMNGYVYVDAAGIAEDRELAAWIGRCVGFARTLPSRPAGRGR